MDVRGQSWPCLLQTALKTHTSAFTAKVRDGKGVEKETCTYITFKTPGDILSSHCFHFSIVPRLSSESPAYQNHPTPTTF